VGLGVDRDRPGAEADEQAVQALVQQAAGALGRRQVPGRAVEQVGARGVDAGRLGARDRMPADEARVVDRRRQRALGRSDVGHERVVACGGERVGDERRQRAHRRAGEDGVRTLDGVGDRAGGAVDRAAL
jgi:hypothetical protein